MISRRKLVQLGASAAAVSACARRIAESPVVDVPATGASELRIPRSLVPQLDAVGGNVRVRASGFREVLLANAGNGFIAVSAECPHAGCPLSWVHEDLEFECPCHGSRFSSDGAVLAPPAQEDVDAFEVRVEPGVLVVTLPASGGFPAVDAGGFVTLTLVDHPELQTVGGFVPGVPRGLSHGIVVLRVSQTEVRAFDATCTHQGCTVKYDLSSQHFECPCHRSEYANDGTVLKSAASGQKPLRTYPVTFDGKQAVVQVR